MRENLKSGSMRGGWRGGSRRTSRLLSSRPPDQFLISNPISPEANVIDPLYLCSTNVAPANEIVPPTTDRGTCGYC